MRAETNVLHDQAVRIGTSLGFETRREVGIVPVGEEAQYAPILDLAWLRPLSKAQRQAIATVGAHLRLFGTSLLVAGWEVEGSDAPTRAMQADLANIRVSGAPYGFLALGSDPKNNLYSRARRASRTQRHYFGAHDSLVLDTAWIEALSEASWNARLVPAPEKRKLDAKASGGETEWAGTVRARIRELGEAAGFDVWFDYPSRLALPTTRTVSAIDVVWALPMPRGLGDLAREIVRRADDELDEPVVDARFDHVAVVGFEIENNFAKHAHGALLNLASHAMAGVFIGGTARAVCAAEAAHRTYAGVFPLSGVTVNKDFTQ